MVLAHGLDKSFKNINESVSNTNSCIEEISEALAQQSIVCEDLVNATDVITTAVSDVENKNANLNTITEKLKNAAEQLDTKIMQFKI
jgi:methyl-accepting chemotaxis protein